MEKRCSGLEKCRIISDEELFGFRKMFPQRTLLVFTILHLHFLNLLPYIRAIKECSDLNSSYKRESSNIQINFSQHYRRVISTFHSIQLLRLFMMNSNDSSVILYAQVGNSSAAGFFYSRSIGTA